MQLNFNSYVLGNSEIKSILHSNQLVSLHSNKKLTLCAKGVSVSLQGRPAGANLPVPPGLAPGSLGAGAGRAQGQALLGAPLAALVVPAVCVIPAPDRSAAHIRVALQPGGTGALGLEV